MLGNVRQREATLGDVRQREATLGNDVRACEQTLGGRGGHTRFDKLQSQPRRIHSSSKMVVTTASFTDMHLSHAVYARLLRSD